MAFQVEQIRKSKEIKIKPEPSSGGHSANLIRNDIKASKILACTKIDNDN